jgi:hypothetical protein
MTTHEFDERLSAYLDGKLSATERAQVEAELQQNPELQAALEQLKKLDQIARQSQMDLPADGYFDGLAGRIDAKLARDARPRRGLAILQPIMPKGRLIAIISSVAALFLIVVVVNQIWKPEVERFSVPKTIIVNPPQQRETSRKMETQPAIATEPLKASDQKRKPEIPDSVLGKVVESDRPPVGVKDEEYKEPPVFPEPKKTDQPLAVPEATTITPAASPVDTLRQYLQPREKSSRMIIRTIDSSASRGEGKPLLDKPATALSDQPANAPQSALVPTQAEMDASIVRREQLPKIGISIPLAIDSLQIVQPELQLNKGKFTETFDAAAYEQLVQAMLDSGKYVPVYFVAWKDDERKTSSPYDAENSGYQDWYDSLSVMGSKYWQAENAYREAKRSRGNRLAEYITARLYIEHYLNSSHPLNADLWRERLDEVRQLERGVRK